MNTPRRTTAVRMKEARERIDAFEAQEAADSAPAPPNRLVAALLWLAVIALGVAIYFFSAWYQSP